MSCCQSYPRLKRGLLWLCSNLTHYVNAGQMQYRRGCALPDYKVSFNLNNSVALLYMRCSWVRRLYLIQKQISSPPAHIYYSKISSFHPHFLPSRNVACLRTPSTKLPFFICRVGAGTYKQKMNDLQSQWQREKEKRVSLSGCNLAYIRLVGQFT